MNLLTKDKYRTKIMQHVLHQYANQQADFVDNQIDNNKIFQDMQNVKDQCQKIYSSMLFEKVSKQKALIIDSERQAYKNIPQSKYLQKQQRKNQLIDQIQPKNHLHKQPYVYHQKLPVMSVSNTYDEEILKKLKKNVKTKISNQNKENHSKVLNNNESSQTKQKKYRFIAANKVAEALKSKLQVQSEKICSKEQIKVKCQQQQFEEQKDKTTQFKETHRSQGSKQMMQFLQSARQKLFENMNHQNYELQTQFNKKSEIQPQQIEKVTECERNKPSQNTSELTKNFKIQIQVSANKTCQIQLNWGSDPKIIANKFILSNKDQLSSFKEHQIQKLQELLSNKISLQIQKQRKLIKLKAEKNIQDRFRKIINHTGVNEILLNEEEQEKANGQQMRKNSFKNNKKLQFSHIYIENIDLPNASQAQVDEDEKVMENKKKQEENKECPKMKKTVTFNPIHHENLFQKDPMQDNSLKGYQNSPHQLITYRQSDSQSENSSSNFSRQIYESSNKLKEEGLISHFPLSASLSELPKNHKNHQSPQKNQITQDKNVKNIDRIQNEVGAAKILSKSRSKLSKHNKQNHLKNSLEVSYKEMNQSDNNIVKNQISATHGQNLQPISNSLSSNPSTSTPSINTISEQIISRLGKQNILNSMKQKQLTKRQKILKQKQAKELQEMKQCSFRPKINHLSKSIDQNKKKKIKIGELLENDVEKQLKFKESISVFSRDSSVAYTSNQLISNMTQSQQFDKIMSRLQASSKKTYESTRYQQLYQNFKHIQARKEYIRQKSLQQISFKPQINRISKKIVQTKRGSLNNSTCQQFYNPANSMSNFSRHQSTCKKSFEKRNSMNYSNDNFLYEDKESKAIHNKRKSLNFSRNLQGLQIGDYLYKEAMRIKKKKQTMTQSKVENFKPLQKSQKIINKVKQKRLSQYFYELLNIKAEQNTEYDFVLKPELVNLSEQKFTKSPMKYLLPLLQQLKQLNISLTKEEFIESGLKLFNFLSQDEKAQFLGKKSVQRDENDPTHQPSINKLSQQLVTKKQYYLQDIYHRGLLYKKQIKDKVQLDMEDKVRKELEKCTFKPKINTAYQTIQ